ncbi:hypothetical protein KCP70_03160 [Salmonella enterica subsp. enterica]|nr:hypothetical protein KCP70_03160 [Salmonella enterica subsp. enterica]
MKASERDKQLALISWFYRLPWFQPRDLVIEAVFEDPPLNNRWWRSGANCAALTPFLPSNTFLPIGDIAANAARPEQVIGLRLLARSKKCRWLRSFLTLPIRADHRHDR